MATMSREDVVAARVIADDDQFMIVEIAKSDDVEWTVKPLPGEDAVEFWTMVFVSFKDGEPDFTKPWERA